MTTLVFGHKSPDTDSTGSPIIWAWYLTEVKGQTAEPVLLGEPNTEAAFVSGVPMKRTVIAAYSGMGAIVAITGFEDSAGLVVKCRPLFFGSFEARMIAAESALCAHADGDFDRHFEGQEILQFQLGNQGRPFFSLRVSHFILLGTRKNLI